MLLLCALEYILITMELWLGNVPQQNILVCLDDLVFVCDISQTNKHNLVNLITVGFILSLHCITIIRRFSNRCVTRMRVLFM